MRADSAGHPCPPFMVMVAGEGLATTLGLGWLLSVTQARADFRNDTLRVAKLLLLFFCHICVVL